jgi:CheY-like chemotaxis protein
MGQYNNMTLLPGKEIILVVDDEFTILSLTQMILAEAGYGVLVAASGKEALRLFEVWPNIKLNLMLVDIIMPDMNGPELVDHVWKTRPELPVLYFSGYAGKEFIQPEIACKVPYMEKPFTSLQLTTRIREILERSHANVASAEG